MPSQTLLWKNFRQFYFDCLLGHWVIMYTIFFNLEYKIDLLLLSEFSSYTSLIIFEWWNFFFCFFFWCCICRCCYNFKSCLQKLLCKSAKHLMGWAQKSFLRIGATPIKKSAALTCSGFFCFCWIAIGFWCVRNILKEDTWFLFTRIDKTAKGWL